MQQASSCIASHPCPIAIGKDRFWLLIAPVLFASLVFVFPSWVVVFVFPAKVRKMPDVSVVVIVVGCDGHVPLP